MIGAGQFGQVYLATFRDARVAVKTVRLAASDDDKEDFVHEAEVMLDLKNEGLVQLLGVAVQQRYGTFRPNFHRFDRFELDLRGHTQP